MKATTGSEELRDKIDACWSAAKAVEPKPGGVTEAQLAAVREAVDAAAEAHLRGVDGATGEQRAELEGSLATAIARAAAVAIAAGNDTLSARWLADARHLSKNLDQRDELDAAKQSPERYRLLVHARNRFAAGEGTAAREHWQALIDDESVTDAIRNAALREIDTKPPYDGNMPELFTWNGFGLRFVGSRDEHRDGSYVTTHCATALFLPVFPLASYRVLRERDRYHVLEKLPLSPFARLARVATVGAAALAVVAYLVAEHYRDPARLARKRFDDAIAAKGDPQTALERLDAELDGPDLARVDTPHAERAGAAVVRLTSAFAPHPLTRDHVDEVARVVARYQGLPVRARGGAAHDEMLRQLDAWAEELGAPADRGARLVVLRQAWTIADRPRADQYVERIANVRLEVAAERAADWPLDALSVLVEEPVSSAAMARATEIVTRIADQPSLLEDAGADLDAWRQATAASDPLRVKVEAQRALAMEARKDVEAEDVTPEQLAAMQVARPWDQRVAAALAAEELHGGKAEAAETRLRAFGGEGLLVRDARFLLAQIAASREQLEVADAILTRLLDARLARFQAASSALDAAINDTQKILGERLDRGDLPQPLIERLNDGRDEEAQQEAVREWFGQEMEKDQTITARRTVYLAYSDIVPVALAAGTIKLRRAQRMDAAERAAMLTAAERTFLAIRTEAEGQPDFHLALGEIYARLGKHDESDKELKAILDKKDPELTSAVIHVYRDIGSVERATSIATEAYNTFPSPDREGFAALLGLLHADDDDESERWYKKANQDAIYVKNSLLEIEARRLYRQGKDAECAAALAKVARSYLAAASTSAVAFNNAAIAYGSRYECDGDPKGLDEAAAALEKAYRLDGESPIGITNLASILHHRGQLRVLARRVDTRALRMSATDAQHVLEDLLVGSERAKVLAELSADPDLRRARDLMRQYEVLAPNSVDGYQAQMEWAYATRDTAAATAVLERMRRAKSLDTSAQRRAYEEQRAPDEADDHHAARDLKLSLLERLATRPETDARTRAVALRFRGLILVERGVRDGVPADVTAGRAALHESNDLWPAMIDLVGEANAAVDEIAVAHDPQRWTKLRRTDVAAEALWKLVRDGDPLAATIRSAPTWAEVRNLVKASPSLPGSQYLRFAQMLEDPEVSARAEAVIQDASLRAYYELRVLVIPSDEDAAAMLKLLGGR